jgi:putative glutamine amidotransferase
MERPVIAVAAYVDRVRWDIWDTMATVIQQSYIDGVTRGGGRPVVLPPDTFDGAVVHRCDGLVLTSGPDLSPSLYGQSVHPATETPQEQRDIGELLILREAKARGLPILGICRGMQLLAAEAGGRLNQHLPDAVGHEGHCAQVGTMSLHHIRTAPNSLARRIFGEERTVTSHHHQGVSSAGSLWATGHADDGVIEAIEDPAARFVLGVQWHPEVEDDQRLFRAFVEEAWEFSRDRGSGAC